MCVCVCVCVVGGQWRSTSSQPSEPRSRLEAMETMSAIGCLASHCTTLSILGCGMSRVLINIPNAQSSSRVPVERP